MKHAKVVKMSKNGRQESDVSMHEVPHQPWEIAECSGPDMDYSELLQEAGLAFRLAAGMLCVHQVFQDSDPKLQKLDRKTPNAILTFSRATTAGEAQTCRGPRQGTPQDR